LTGAGHALPQAAARHRTEGGRAGRRDIDAFGIDSSSIATMTKAGPPGTERDGGPGPGIASQGKSTS
jgi:hypothetical protein